MTQEKNIWLNGVMGVVIGDALGCPVQFESREEVAAHPVTGMRGYGTFSLPAGSWTDDSSLTLALLESIRSNREIVLEDIMKNFVNWLEEGFFTPYGYAYDIGGGTIMAIHSYESGRDVKTCGGTAESNNGNGSLMRILPACIFCSEQKRSGKLTDSEAVEIIHAVSALTHAHQRSRIACGLYYFMADQVLNGEGSLPERLQTGLQKGFAFYDMLLADKTDLNKYARLRDLNAFAALPVSQIRSSGYVVDSLEAAVWCLITTDQFDQALLEAVNLGLDTDTVGAITGGLAGLFYGYGQIPGDWLAAIQRREWIEQLCQVTL